jgi:hypothetical protein
MGLGRYNIYVYYLFIFSIFILIIVGVGLKTTQKHKNNKINKNKILYTFLLGDVWIFAIFKLWR